MSRVIDYYMAPSSPYSYLGAARFAEIAAAARATIALHPCNMGIVFGATGGLPLPKRSPERRAYRLMELRRWRARLGISFNIEPKFFPVADMLASRMIIAAREQGADAVALALALGRAVWEQERDVADAATLVAIAEAQGLDGAALTTWAQSEDAEAALERESEAAIALGVFGVPTYALGNELYWGQDRLEFLAEALEASLP